MDSLVAAASRALLSGDALTALNRIALREDPPALALRGIAMAQLGEYELARSLLRRAARGFGRQEAVARARCVVAEAEVALAMRDLAFPPLTLARAASALEAHGDRGNALRARLVAVRRLALLGRLDDAQSALARVDARGCPPAIAALRELATAELMLRALRIGAARAALVRARASADASRVPALVAEAAEALDALDRPAARRLSRDGEQPLGLDDVGSLVASGVLVVDGCRRGLRTGDAWRPLARRPVLFDLARTLAEAWPGDAARDALIARAFRTRRPDETHRARLRVEIGRLRALVAPFAGIEATARGFVLRPHDGRDVVVLAPPYDGDEASLLALLADGLPWSTSSLAMATGASQRTVQRALAELEAAGRVRSIGRGRARRWLAPPLTEFTTTLLLPASLPPA